MTPASLSIEGRTVLSSFGKAVGAARALSFCESGGANCSRSCRHHPEYEGPEPGPRCYAVRMEARRGGNIQRKLQRHEATPPDDLLAAAAADLDRHGWRLPWFRFSVSGSVPARVPSGLRRFVARLVKAGTPIHLPIEDARKATRYRKALAGLGVAVSESCQTRRRWLTASGPCSFVAGHGLPMAERVEAAKQAARDRTAATGRRAGVCPAAAASVNRRPSETAKCGNCTLCGDPDFDSVFPAH